MEKYIFRKYEKLFKNLFQKEKKKIVKALGDKISVEHVGSTAIEGLGGKGIIDIIVGIKIGRLNQYIALLEAQGYEFRKKASTPKRLFFRRDFWTFLKKRRIHIHLVKYNSKDWKEMISFRDFLNKHPDVVKEYSKLKKEACLVANGDGQKYRGYKEEYIKRITKEALKN